jgi:ribosomal protein RSM22 (predicted rRNA methylase)
LTGSDTLRKKASSILENTTFIPRLPDYIHATDPNPKGKFDIVIAPYTLWQIREDYARKNHVLNLWSLLKDDGGVLILLEKGVAQGFEAVAGARDMLLEHRILSPPPEDAERKPEHHERIDAPPDSEGRKETGMIVAPCTNHVGCPLYVQKGRVRGRNTICKFAQRYHRPEYLQKVFTANLKGGSGKNHEDVQFSYLSVMRGRDLRAASPSSSPSLADNNNNNNNNNNDGPDVAATTTAPPPLHQNQASTDRAFAGFENGASPQSSPQAHSLSLPRTVFPPLKRTGHVILDVCTPAGTLERWTVPRSFSRRAFRDARKSSWGDLWALGAKSRIVRYLKPVKGQMAGGKGARKRDHQAVAEGHEQEEGAFGDEGRFSNAGQVVVRGDGAVGGDDGAEFDAADELVAQWAASSASASMSSRKDFEVGFEDEGGRKGQVRKGKIKGIREKRDKKGTGGRRRKADADEDD